MTKKKHKGCFLKLARIICLQILGISWRHRYPQLPVPSGIDRQSPLNECTLQVRFLWNQLYVQLMWKKINDFFLYLFWLWIFYFKLFFTGKPRVSFWETLFSVPRSESLNELLLVNLCGSVEKMHILPTFHILKYSLTPVKASKKGRSAF